MTFNLEPIDLFSCSRRFRDTKFLCLGFLGLRCGPGTEILPRHHPHRPHISSRRPRSSYPASRILLFFVIVTSCRSVHGELILDLETLAFAMTSSSTGFREPLIGSMPQGSSKDLVTNKRGPGPGSAEFHAEVLPMSGRRAYRNQKILCILSLAGSGVAVVAVFFAPILPSASILPLPKNLRGRAPYSSIARHRGEKGYIDKAASMLLGTDR